MLGSAALFAAGCGAGERQDANEPEGDFEVDVLEASFPEEQKLAKDSQLRIEVENTDTETIPNIVVTVRGFEYKLRNPEDPSEIDPSVADPRRPVFVLEKSPVEFLRNRSPADQSLVDREVNPPAGTDTVYVDTYGLGALEPGDTALFRWDVSAVKPGPFEISWEVAAGFDGKAKAVGLDGEAPSGTFKGVIDRVAPEARVASDGETIVTGDGRRITDKRDVLTNP